jgi:signal peptidase I
VTANEPPNPYAAPNAAPGGAEAPPARSAAGTNRPSRLLAAATTFLAYPLMGAGFFILGKPRRFAAWATVGALMLAALIIGVRVRVPRLCVAGIMGMFLTILLAVIHTAVTKPGNGLTAGRAWLVAIALVVPGHGAARVIKYTLVEAFQIPAGSMVPNLIVGDHIFVKKGRGDIARGDVIVFEFPQDRSTDYVKRVVALGGDTVEVKSGIVSINGAELAQAAIKNEPNPCPDETGEPGCWFVRETSGDRTYTIMFSGNAASDHPRTVVPEGTVFVLGDNRDNSYDSRKWGTVPIDHIKGKATVIWWSRHMSRIGSGID